MAWPVAGSLASSLRSPPGSSHSCLAGLAAPGWGQMKSSELCHLGFLSQHVLAPPCGWLTPYFRQSSAPMSCQRAFPGLPFLKSLSSPLYSIVAYFSSQPLLPPVVIHFMSLSPLSLTKIWALWSWAFCLSPSRLFPPPRTFSSTE